MEKDYEEITPDNSSTSGILDDQDLVDGIVQNKPGAFDLLLSRYQSLIINIGTMNHGLSAEDAEELCMDVVQEVAKRIASFSSSKGSFRTWMTSIVKRRAIDRYRKVKARLDVEQTKPEIWWNMQSSSEDTAVDLGEDERLRVISVLDQLKPREKILLQLCAENHSREDIGQWLGMSLGNVSTACTRAKKNFRELYDKAIPRVKRE